MTTMKKSVMLILSMAFFISGCGNMNGAQTNQTGNDRANRFGVLNEQQGANLLNTNQGQGVGQGNQKQYKVVVNGQQAEEITSYTQNGENYIPLKQVLQSLDFNVKETEGRILAGFTDVLIDVQINSNKATVEQDSRTLPSPVISLQNEPFITMNSLERLLGEGSQVTTNGDTLTIKTKEEDEGNGIFPDDDMENFEFQRNDNEDSPA